ncbi:uncharacterized protein MONBRDRAFT_33442 [Monosiga brevicollis MX1]|uniref:RING-type domain-containing protein n=1 Tax=Monosiga brevicollis TaxID=81824 RepID=A9V5F1_MONBE|nr:uncharacterized protein MONBRDRAFT_33442 [Monosiga brevicollis MX1]EDQ87271.1 predicted protein [Monosiga brevicollis MX1]|eukprot:XP_001747884.1 hypothetical protein [Monosiga brevicollis MX1]
MELRSTMNSHADLDGRSIHSNNSNHSHAHSLRSGGASSLGPPAPAGISPAGRANHRKTRSDISTLSHISGTSGASQQTIPEGSEELVAFTVQIPSHLICRICQRVFTMPVIARCGHTFCQDCILNAPAGQTCPQDKQPLVRSPVYANRAVQEQINDLKTRCPYGVRPSSKPGRDFEVDPTGCPAIVKYSEREAHKKSCGYMFVRFVAHKLKWTHIYSHAGLRLSKLFCSRKDLDFFRGVLANMSSRFDTLEQQVLTRLADLEDTVQQISREVADASINHETVHNDLAVVQSQIRSISNHVGLSGMLQQFKCQGTFVGHSGHVWALVATNDRLISASADETIRVWDIGSSFACTRTINAHRSIIHCLLLVNNQLYSGSSDRLIKVWSLETFEEIDTLIGHDNVVCALAASRTMLFSGSHQCVNVWSLDSHQLLGQIGDLSHWTRALVASHDLLFVGNSSMIKVWTIGSLKFAEEDPEPSPIRTLVLQNPMGTKEPRAIYSMCLTPQHLIGGTSDGMLHIWDRDTLAYKQALSGHTAIVYSIDFMPGEPHGKLFSASLDRTVRVWSMETFAVLQILHRHDDFVACVRVHHNRVLTASGDSSIKVRGEVFVFSITLSKQPYSLSPAQRGMLVASLPLDLRIATSFQIAQLWE